MAARQSIIILDSFVFIHSRVTGWCRVDLNANRLEAEQIHKVFNEGLLIGRQAVRQAGQVDKVQRK